jgi:hypothetical protein
METAEAAPAKSVAIDDFNAAVSALATACMLIARAGWQTDDARQKIGDWIERQKSLFPDGMPSRDVFETVLQLVAAGIRHPGAGDPPIQIGPFH